MLYKSSAQFHVIQPLFQSLNAFIWKALLYVLSKVFERGTFLAVNNIYSSDEWSLVAILRQISKELIPNNDQDTAVYGDAHSKTRGSAKKFFLRFYFNYILFYSIIQEKKIFVYNTLIKKFFIK